MRPRLPFLRGTVAVRLNDETVHLVEGDSLYLTIPGRPLRGMRAERAIRAQAESQRDRANSRASEAEAALQRVRDSLPDWLLARAEL